MSDSQQHPGLLAVSADGLTAEEAGRNAADGLALLGQIMPGTRTADIDTRTLAEILAPDQAADNDPKEA